MSSHSRPVRAARCGQAWRRCPSLSAPVAAANALATGSVSPGLEDARVFPGENQRGGRSGLGRAGARASHPVLNWTLGAAQLAMMLIFAAYCVSVQISAVAYLAGRHHAIRRHAATRRGRRDGQADYGHLRVWRETVEPRVGTFRCFIGERLPGMPATVAGVSARARQRATGTGQE
jgi:hypothetical protein